MHLALLARKYRETAATLWQLGCVMQRVPWYVRRRGTLLWV